MHEGRAYPMLMSMHLSIVSRMILSYKNEFHQFINELTQIMGQHSNSDEVSGQLLDVWIDKMPCVTQPERRKLLSLALTSLMSTGSPLVLQRIFGLLLNVTETLNDIMHTKDGGSAGNSSLIE